jgi:hypothetical protein
MNRWNTFGLSGRGVVCLAVLCAGLVSLAPPVPAQERRVVPVQVHLERADRALRWPAGQWRGRLSLAEGDGRRRAWDFTLFQQQDRRRIDFYSTRRGLEARVLYLDQGRTIWHWDAPRAELSRKRDGEQYGSLLQSGFSFVDLSGRGLEPDYAGERRAERYSSSSAPTAATAGDRELLRLTLRPVRPPREPGGRGYGRVVLLVDPARAYRPLRMDLYDADRILTRSLQYHYDSELRMGRAEGAGALDGVPTRLEMLDLSGGGISRIEFYEFDDAAELPAAFFDPEFLNR